MHAPKRTTGDSLFYVSEHDSVHRLGRMLILLHGAVGDQTQLYPLREQLSRPDVHSLNFAGHGARTLDASPFRLESFADDLLAWLDSNASEPADIFGYSMGGYVALYVAALHPERVRSVFTLGTRLRWTPEAAAEMCAQLDAAKIAEKVPRFAAQLEGVHRATGWQRVLALTCDALRALGEKPLLTDTLLARISCPVRLAVGDRDLTVAVEEVRDASRLLPKGEFEVLPNTPHPIERVSLQRVVFTLQQFHASVDRSLKGKQE